MEHGYLSPRTGAGRRHDEEVGRCRGEIKEVDFFLASDDAGARSRMDGGGRGVMHGLRDDDVHVSTPSARHIDQSEHRPRRCYKLCLIIYYYFILFSVIEAVFDCAVSKLSCTGSCVVQTGLDLLTTATGAAAPVTVGEERARMMAGTAKNHRVSLFFPLCLTRS